MSKKCEFPLVTIIKLHKNIKEDQNRVYVIV